ncbi:MAG: metal-dependent phosphohydrolase, partial [Thermoleophilaceae bacterium]|nr:metal-dependent phosphohydrolase [Thermoleophilaceae bacterium]
LNGVAALTRAVARSLELSADDIDVLVRAAELHDAGKVAVGGLPRETAVAS